MCGCVNAIPSYCTLRDGYVLQHVYTHTRAHAYTHTRDYGYNPMQCVT